MAFLQVGSTAFSSRGTNAAVTVWPANYTANQIQGDYFFSSDEPNLAMRELAAASDDPGTFTLSASRRHLRGM